MNSNANKMSGNVITDINIILQLSSNDIQNPNIQGHLSVLNTMKHINKIMIINNLDEQDELINKLEKKSKSNPNPLIKEAFKADNPIDIDTSIFDKDSNQNNVIICNSSVKENLKNKLKAKMANTPSQTLDDCVFITYKNNEVINNLELILYALQTNFRTRSNQIVDYDEKLSELLYNTEKLFGFVIRPDITGKNGLTNDEQTIMMNIMTNTRKDKSMYVLNMTDINLELEGGGLLGKLGRKIRRMRGKKTIKSKDIKKAPERGDAEILQKYGKNNKQGQLFLTASQKKGKTASQKIKAKHNKVIKKKDYNLQVRKNYPVSLLLVKDGISSQPEANYKISDFDIVFEHKNLKGLQILDFILYTDVDEPEIDTVMRYMGKTQEDDKSKHSKKYKKRSAGLTPSERKIYKTQKKKRIQDILEKEKADKEKIGLQKLKVQKTMKRKSEDRKKIEENERRKEENEKRKEENERRKEENERRKKAEDAAYKKYIREKKAYAKRGVTKSQKKKQKQQKKIIENIQKRIKQAQKHSNNAKQDIPVINNKDKGEGKGRKRGLLKRFFGIGKNSKKNIRRVSF
jgi:hypothetical protein